MTLQTHLHSSDRRAARGTRRGNRTAATRRTRAGLATEAVVAAYINDIAITRGPQRPACRPAAGRFKSPLSA